MVPHSRPGEAVKEDTLRFGVLDLPDASFSVLKERWRLIEDLGFDHLWTADHTSDYRDLSGPWLDGWVTLAAMASGTSHIRIGTLVSNPILRHPVILAKQAASVDHLSAGRLDLGIGTGIAPFDHAAVGTEYWPPRERAGRFTEYVRIVDELLSSGEAPYGFQGHHYTSHRTRLVPAPLQRPRPPLTLGGQSPTVLRVAAERADAWNTHGPFGATVDEIAETTRRQGERLDLLCEASGRNPRDLRRSLLLFEALDAWTAPDAFERVVDRFLEIGFRDFVVFWPGDDRRHLLEDVAMRVIPRLRGSSESPDLPGARPPS